MSIYALLQHDELRVRELGELLNTIASALDQKKITEQEYVTLMIDAERLKEVMDLSEDLELRLKINAAFKVVIQIAKMVNL